jgi:acetolactate synthase-1/2/3 large subunit
MPNLTGGQALVQQLKMEGVDVVFALPGVQLDWAFDALYEAREHMRVVHTRHEQATAYMADGYARTSGRVGACLVVPGPGLLNASAGLATAYACSSPVLCVAGQINSDLLGLGRGVLHEINNQLETITAVTKWAARPMSPDEVPRVVHEAFRHLRTGRPRPVEIEVPPDILMAQSEVTLYEQESLQASVGDPDLLDRAAKLLGQAAKPIIFVGGGIHSRGGWEQLQLLAELLEAPVVMSSNGRAALSERHYLAMVAPAGPHLLPLSDVVLAVGTRFVQPATAPWGVKPHQQVVQLDVDPTELGRNYSPTVSIHADAKEGLAELANRVQRYNRSRTSRQEELLALKARIREDFDQDQHRAPWAHAIRTELPEDGILISESTQVGYWCNAGGFPVYQPRTFLTSGYQGTLGYGFAAALGAQVANPDKKVVSLNGDGGFMYNVQELSTAAMHKINVVAIVFNDSAYGNVKRIQETRFGGRTIACELHNPDFVKLAESFGVQGMRARSPEDLRLCLRTALNDGVPTLIDVPVGPMPMMTIGAAPQNRRSQKKNQRTTKSRSLA